jgi:hypothetical protein
VQGSTPCASTKITDEIRYILSAALISATFELLWSWSVLQQSLL